MADEDRIYRQIEATADHYQPAVYSLLSFYHALETEPDAHDSQFIPVTVRRSEDCKLFAVGLIPPVGVGNGRLLDRRASVLAFEKHFEDVPDVSSSSTGDLPGQTSGLPTSTPIPVGPTSTDSRDFYDQFVAMCNRLGCQAEELAAVIQSESSWNEHAKNSIAKGLIQLVKTTACGRLENGRRVGGLGMSEAEYEQFENSSRIEQLPWIEKFYQGRAKGKNAGQLKRITFGGYNNPDGSLWHSVAEPQPPDYKKYKNAQGQRNAYLLNQAVDGPPKKGYITVEDLNRQVAKHELNAQVREGIRQAKARLGMSKNAPYRNEVVESTVTVPERWPEKGKDCAAEAAKKAALMEKKDLERAAKGALFAGQQELAIKAMNAAVETIANTPPLRMMVNPQSFKVSAEKVIASNWGRSGHIVEHWGEQQDKIEGSGKVAAFYSMDANNAGGPGLTRTARHYSASYQNFLGLFLLYKNNGGVYFRDPTLPDGAKGNNLAVVGSVYLYFDNILYLGSFDSLTVNESDEAPFTLEYSFSFTVRAWFLLDREHDPRFTYGRDPNKSLLASSGRLPLQGGNAQPNPEVAPPPPAPTQGELPVLAASDDPIFGLNDGDIGDDLEGIV